ncbi:ATP-binding cassette domain-containing protein [Gordonia sp. NB41Y]|uniref:ABC transporter ATP-binding protein n=1 Tax=Gordonia sp. NB41Y TaxID=875808 RepID=UPI0002BF450A|nr:ATP-binding cassette domain-containing protein [Gordonia sp. NB41Y]EMP12596.1 ABC transporter [Gordonia sp. NB41Y]WLP89995.1 ATP-binding cassette domain-containing protein [Gordonia sp. NB41Y]
MNAMITVENLTKRYGDYVAVDDISFACRAGQVTGFLGPNGAGKSTTMRIMAGLTPATAGRATIDGSTYRDLDNPATEVGVLLDASAQHAGRTGEEILRLSAMTIGVPRSRVDDMLELVSLTPEEAGRRVRNYSLGMRQRLGLANALMGDPHILILDEPANGLDPAGIHWMRGLLRDYADRGGTVLLSSHLLHEIEIVADDLVVIGNGRIVAQGTKAELLAGTGTVVRSTDDTALATALITAGLRAQAATGGGLNVDAQPADVGAVAAVQGIALTELRAGDGARLEEMFLSLTAADQREQPLTAGAL